MMIPPRVYPRVGGGNLHDNMICRHIPGLSPRGRGKHIPLSPPSFRLRSIPAWAGETPPVKPMADDDRVYPRVGGGNYNRCA